MAITRTAWIDDDGSGTTGTIINNAEKTLLYDQIDAALVSTAGTVIATPYAAGDYVGFGTMTWTVTAGNVQANWAQRTGGLLQWHVAINGSVTAGTATAVLNIKIPAGMTIGSFTEVIGQVYQAASGWVDTFVTATAGGTTVQIARVGNTDYTIDSNTFLRFQINLPVV